MLFNMYLSSLLEGGQYYLIWTPAQGQLALDLWEYPDEIHQHD
jgi:hypothetical protein